jgi:hypothetical protein
LLGKTLTPRQYELFGMPAAGPAPEDERAENEGRAAGFRMDDEPGSKEQDNPYEIGSQKGQAWLKGFRKGRPERNTLLAMQKTEPEPGAAAGTGKNDEDGGA